MVFASTSFAASPYFYRGYAHVNGSLAPNGTIIEVYLNGTGTVLNSVVVGSGSQGGLPQGQYSMGFEANSGDKIAFRVNNLTLIAENGTNVTAQTIVSGGILTDNFNLSVNKSSQGNACQYAGGCSSGFCTDGYCCNSACGGASEDCNVAGSLGTCTSTASSSGSSSSGGGGGGSSTPSTTETLTVASVGAGSTATFTTTNAASLGVETIQFTSSVSATNVQVTVKEVKETAITTTATSLASSSGAVYKYLEITKTGLQTSQMSSVKVNFKVPKSWLNSNNIDKNTVTLNRYNNGWTKLATTIRSEDATYVYYAADTPGFSTFAITGEKGATFFELISKIDDYYAGRITFFALIDAIDLYYNSQ